MCGIRIPNSIEFGKVMTARPYFQYLLQPSIRRSCLIMAGRYPIARLRAFKGKTRA
jgi:hypothetical protein